MKKAVVNFALALLVYAIFALCYFYCIDKCPDANTALPEYAFGVGFTFWPYMFCFLLVMVTGGHLGKQLYLRWQQSKN